ncbi:MAG: hypothetical protein A2283_04005 [Lentisphaerae bacterium RIFOXYA12_FULL_48_11]|nr:MAG: hypothetical protein A2283_04005 [Lentisphaerae bacterium RIFOXYA12_FULL_48_11]
MKIRTIALIVLMLASIGSFLAAAEVAVETKAKADYDATEKSAREAEAAAKPLKDAMQKADKVYADAKKAADTKRQQATDAKNLSGEQGVKDLKQAEDDVPVAIKTLTDATNAKPPLDKALADAKAAVFPLKQAYDAAEKAAKEAEAMVKIALDAANKLDDEAKKATNQAAARRRAADSAKAALARAHKSEQSFQNQAEVAPKKIAEAEMQKKTADADLAAAKTQLASAMTAYHAAETAALTAETNAKLVSEAEKKQATDEAATKRKLADAARTTLTQAQQNEQQLQAKSTAATQKLADAPVQKKAVDDALASARNQVAAANGSSQAAEKAAQGAEATSKSMAENVARTPDEKKKAADEAVAKRRASDAAKAALAQAQQNEQQAKVKADAAAKNLADAPVQKKTADDALAKAKNQVAVANGAYQASEKAAQEAEAVAKVIAERAGRSEEQKTHLAAEAAAKRKAANEAKAAMARAQLTHQNFEKLANVATQKLNRAMAQKKAAEDGMVDARNQITAATAACQVAEQATVAATKLAEEKSQAAAEAASKRKAAAETWAILAQAQQVEQQAQDKANAAAKALTDATAQKKASDDALANIKNQVAAASTTLATAEKTAQEAASAVKAISGNVITSPEDKKKAAGEAPARRKAADAAKVALVQAQQNEQAAQAQAVTASQKLAEAETQKKDADIVLANATKQRTAAAAANQAAEKAAKDLIQLDAVRSQAAYTSNLHSDLALNARRSRKRIAVIDAAEALAQAQQVEQQAQDKANAAAKALTDATTRKKTADDALVGAKNQMAAATTTSVVTEKVAREAEAAVARLAADMAKTVLVQAQQNEQAAQAQAATAAKKLAEVEAQKKAADVVLANAKLPVTAAMPAYKAAQDAGGEIVRLDMASKQASADAAAKRKAANEAKAVLDPVQAKLDQASIQAGNAAQNLERAEARKKLVEEGLVKLKERIAAAKQTHQADEQAAQTAEAAAAPLKEAAEKTRVAYSEAVKIADDKRALVEQAKAKLYRLVASGQVGSLMDSPEPPKPANRIDEIVFAKLKALGIQPVLCSDAVFIRRAYLDMTGTLPSAEEAKAFILSTDKNKRVALADRLLDHPAHVNYWAMRWSDILKVKAEFPVKVWPNAAQAYHRWIWESINQNKRYDQFARELLTSSGSNFRVGSVNFYRAIQNKTPEGIAAAVGLALMGTRIHLWPEDRRTGMKAFFTQIGYKPTSEWKEEIVFWDPLNSVAVPNSTAPGIDSVAKAVTVTDQIPQALTNALTENGPLAAVFPDGTKTTISPNRDPREVFADWLIRPENPWFARAIVNRTWAWMIGRGIIHEPDDIRDGNPPSNAEVLACLEKELVSSGYNLKHLKRLILTSTVYQFSSIPRSKSPEAGANFASYPLRRVEGEVLIDALNSITGGSDLYTSAVPEPFTYIPQDMSAVELADGSISSSFLTLFGRSARATGMESERINELDSTQWLCMLNSTTIQNKLQSGQKLASLFSAGGKPNEIAERLYLTILSRFPTDADIRAAEEYAKSGVTKGNNVWIDLAWALINSPEFLMRH